MVDSHRCYQWHEEVMASLARTTLVREWRRFMPAVFAVGFAGLLVFMQLALMLGMFRTVSVSIDQSTADLWVGYPDALSVDQARNIPSRLEVSFRMHPDVTEVEPFLWVPADVRKPDGPAASGQLLGIDTRPGGMLLARVLSPSMRQALDEPDTVLVDIANAANLDAHIGGTLEINGKRVKVVGLTHGLGAIGGPNVVTSLDTARRLDSASLAADDVTYLLLRLRNPLQAARVRDELQPHGRTRLFQVWTAAEFSIRSQLYWLLETGMGLGFAFSGGLALMIGVVITSQTLKSVINGSLREYATLRALGVSRTSLRAVVVEQSWWVGLMGTSVTMIVTALLVRLAQSFHVLISAPLWAYAGTAGFVLAIALVSGLLALRALSFAEPAILLR